MDLSKLSDKDLEALSRNDLVSMSDAALRLIAGEVEEPTPAKKTKRQIVDEAMTLPAMPTMGVGKAGDLLRQLGLTARAGIAGATAIPTMLAEPIAALTGQPSQAGQLQKLLTQLGLPEPKTAQERVVQDITSAGAGIAAPAALTRFMPAAAQKFFAENLGTQAAAGAAGALASGSARESDVGPMGQMIAGTVGAMGGGAPAALGPAAARAAKETVRPFTQAGREVITGNVLRSLATSPEQAIKAGEAYVPPVSGYQPTTAQATRDIGLISAETAIRGLDVGKGKFGVQGIEANRARMAILDRLAKDEGTLQAAIQKRNEVTGPMREQAFSQATVDPETFQSAVTLTVNKTIDDILASPAGKRSTVQSVMDDARNDIARASTPQELYEIRKDLRAAAQGLLDKSSRNGPSSGAYKVAKNELEQVIRSVDDAIESAAPGYKDYLRKYSQSSKGIERLEAAQEFKGKVLSTTPDPSTGEYLISQPSFVRAIRSAEKDTKLSKTQLAVLKKVASDLDSGVLARGVKVPGSDTFKNMSTANVIGGIIGKQMFGDMPPAFSKMMAPMNWLYNGTDDAIRELIVDAMLDPKLASRLMSKASVVSIEPISKELQKKAMALGYGATFGLTE
jgi:hypothetical protein